MAGDCSEHTNLTRAAQRMLQYLQKKKAFNPADKLLVDVFL